MTKQLYDSIDKLFHYIFSYVKQETHVRVERNRVYGVARQECVYENLFTPPSTINISWSLYNRIDNCHGAGNCCRVPFDLIYTPYCRSRILEADAGVVVNRQDLLDSLETFVVRIKWDGAEHTTQIYVKQNIDINPMSGAASCPYLEIKEDRYMCGIHFFKPLHCWYPHMTVRQHGDDGSVNIGRMQYGRNHNFGCPVIFKESISGEELVSLPDGVDYFDKQFESDLYKLNWTSNAAKSLLFSSATNFAVGLGAALLSKGITIKRQIECGSRENIELWRRKNES